MPTTGFSTQPLKVKLLAGEHQNNGGLAGGAKLVRQPLVDVVWIGKLNHWLLYRDCVLPMAQYCGWTRRNPFAPSETIVCWYLQGNHQTPGFLRWSRILSIHSMGACTLNLPLNMEYCPKRMVDEFPLWVV